MRVAFPASAFKRPLDSNDVRRFQSGPCWVWSDEQGMILVSLQLKLPRGWFTAAAWSAIGSFVEGGRVVRQDDLVAVLEGLGPLVPPY